MSTLRRTPPGNFSEDLDQLVARLSQPRQIDLGDSERRKYVPRRAARCPAMHNRLLFGEAWR